MGNLQLSYLPQGISLVEYFLRKKVCCKPHLHVLIGSLHKINKKIFIFTLEIVTKKILVSHFYFLRWLHDTRKQFFSGKKSLSSGKGGQAK